MFKVLPSTLCIGVCVGGVFREQLVWGLNMVVCMASPTSVLEDAPNSAQGYHMLPASNLCPAFKVWIQPIEPTLHSSAQFLVILLLRIIFPSCSLYNQKLNFFLFVKLNVGLGL